MVTCLRCTEIESKWKRGAKMKKENKKQSEINEKETAATHFLNIHFRQWCCRMCETIAQWKLFIWKQLRSFDNHVYSQAHKNVQCTPTAPMQREGAYLIIGHFVLVAAKNTSNDRIKTTKPVAMANSTNKNHHHHHNQFCTIFVKYKAHLFLVSGAMFIILLTQITAIHRLCHLCLKLIDWIAIGVEM